MPRIGLVLVLASVLACSEPADTGTPPASYARIVALAPSLTELVFAAGAGDTLVGVSAFSDYPPAALDIPVVGDAFNVDQETLALIRPDAILVWESGMATHRIDALQQMGYRIERVRTRSLGDVSRALRRIGAMTGRETEADAAADSFDSALQSLASRHAGARPVSVFYQVDRQPLYTINGEHYVSELIQLCGGENIFRDLNSLAPSVSVEAVIERDPEVMLASSDAGADAFAEWRRWPNMLAVREGNLYIMPADEIGRATPRLVNAGKAVCEALQLAREKRGDD